jgi:hypothetical protein
VKAGIPDTVKEVVYIEIAHYEPFPVTVTVDGVHPSLILSLPRSMDPKWQLEVEKASEALERNGSKLLAALMKRDSKFSIRGKEGGVKV